MRGRIKSLKKTFGFISGVDGQDHFFHWSFLSERTKTFGQLTVGTTVEFEAVKVTQENQEKNQAKNIVAVD